MTASRSFKSTPARKSTGNNPTSYAEDLSAGPMLRYEAALPRLPVPPLTSTCSKYLDSVRPHLTDAEFLKTQAAVKSFLDSPLAHDLQQRLEARAADPEIKNWLADWWNDVAYMAYRDPVVVFVSYYYVHLDDRRIREPAKRAASLVKAMLAFREMVESCVPAYSSEPRMCTEFALESSSNRRRSEALPYPWTPTSGCEYRLSRPARTFPERAYHRFHSSRYPTKPSDTAQKFDYKQNNHVVFVRKNKFFEVSLATKDGQELTAAELEV